MTALDTRTAVLQSLGRIAPEVDMETLLPNVEFRDQLDIDSFDFLNYIIALCEATGAEIPESDYPKLGTLDGAVAYLGERA